MTPELKAAAERVRRVTDKQSVCEAYQLGFTEAMRQFQADESLLARAYLAEHPADDDEPVTLDFMESVVPEDGSITIATHGEVGRAYLDEGYVADGIEIKDREQLRYLLKGLGR